MEEVGHLDDPRARGKALTADHAASLWRYRAGDYRIVCQIKDDALVIIVVKVAHRRHVYD
ncbi:MAG: type II toxin-antitoxin system RelE/ParE family toxin [Thermomicrobiales bacterium]